MGDQQLFRLIEFSFNKTKLIIFAHLQNTTFFEASPY